MFCDETFVRLPKAVPPGAPAHFAGHVLRNHAGPNKTNKAHTLKRQLNFSAFDGLDANHVSLENFTLFQATFAGVALIDPVIHRSTI